MNPHQHNHLNTKNCKEDGLKWIVVKKGRPENLKAAIKKRTKGTYSGQCAVIDASLEAELLVGVGHVILIEKISHSNTI